MKTYTAVKSGVKKTQDHQILDAKQSIEKVSSIFFGSALATAVSLTLNAVFGISLLEILGAVLIGYMVGKQIITKVLPKYIKSFSSDKALPDAPLPEREYNPEMSASVASKQLNTSIKASTRRALAIAALTYLFAHAIAPLIPKIMEAMPFLSPLLQALALAVPGLQIAAAAFFAITIMRVLYKKYKEYQIAKRNEQEVIRKDGEEINQLPNQSVSVDGPKISMTSSREAIVAFVSIAVCNFAILTLQISALVLGFKIVMPIASIILGSFIAGFIVFYAIPKGTYKIVVSLQKQEVSKVAAKASLKPSPDTPKVEQSKSKKLDIKITRLNQIMAIATLSMVSQHMVKALFQLPFIQHFVLIATGFVAVTAVALYIIPRRINSNRLRAFKQSETFAIISGNAQEVSESLSNQNDVDLANAREINTEKTLELFSTRPDIVLATLLTAYKGKEDEKGQDISEKLEASIVNHGFRDIDISIDEVDDWTLALIKESGEKHRETTLAGPYFQKVTEKTVTVNLPESSSASNERRSTSQVTLGREHENKPNSVDSDSLHL